MNFKIINYVFKKIDFRNKTFLKKINVPFYRGLTPRKTPRFCQPADLTLRQKTVCRKRRCIR